MSHSLMDVPVNLHPSKYLERVEGVFNEVRSRPSNRKDFDHSKGSDGNLSANYAVQSAYALLKYAEALEPGRFTAAISSTKLSVQKSYLRIGYANAPQIVKQIDEELVRLFPVLDKTR